MTKAQGETIQDTGMETTSKLKAFFQGWSSYKIPFLSLLFFGALAIKSLYPDLLSMKRNKSYRFRGNALGFFVGDLSLFTTSSTEEAETRLVQVFPEKLQGKVQKVIRPVLTLCEKHEVDPFWVLSVMWTESHFRFKATSKKGAQGLMQVMPETYGHLLAQMKTKGMKLESDRGEDYLATVYREAYDEMGYHLLVQKLRNLEVGIYYLKTLLNDFDHNHFHATVAYNMGPTWTRDRLRSDLPVAIRNHYLNKVMEAYIHITKNLSHNANVSFVSNQL
jgi:hypothetical protein